MCKECKTCTFFYDDHDENEYKRYNCVVMDTYTQPNYICSIYKKKDDLNEDVNK